MTSHIHKAANLQPSSGRTTNRIEPQQMLNLLMEEANIPETRHFKTLNIMDYVQIIILIPHLC